jgi:hypothetical protein
MTNHSEQLSSTPNPTSTKQEEIYERPVTPFHHSASLTNKHSEELSKRGITADFALKSGVRSAADNELRVLNFQASLPISERSKGLQGLCFPYVDLDTNAEAAWRIKPDTKLVLGDGSSPKYLSRIGDKPRPYYPHNTKLEFKANVKINVIITEGEYKSLSVAENIIPIASRPTCVIGLQGVNGGWHRDKTTVQMPDGTKETRKEGHPHLIDDLLEWEWRKRVVYIVFDSDVGTKNHASEFKRNHCSGAMGAEFTLSQLLKAQGADVRIVEIPHVIGQDKVGIDDYIVRYGKHQALRLIYNNFVSERDADKVLQLGDPTAWTFMTAKNLVAAKPNKPPFAIDKLLPIGGVMVIAAAPKIGKSAIALNAAHAIATGGRFLDIFPVQKGRAAYIQTEIPAWSMAERLTKMGDIPDDLIVLTPPRMALNYWEDDGYNKRRETGNRVQTSNLVRALQDQAVSLVIFDPYRHFSSLNENNVDHVTHMFEIYRGIAIALQAGVIIVHHHRKIQRANVKYEGAEDMSGSGAFFGEPDSILSIYRNIDSSGNSRFKMVFDTRHAEPLEPYELYRQGGDNCMLWKAEPWVDLTKTHVKLPTIEKIFEYVESNGPVHYQKIIDACGCTKSTLYRHLEELQKTHRVVQKGNLYEVNFGD